MLSNSILFTPQKIGPITIPNRFIRSPISWRDADDNGFSSKNELDHMVDLARGRVGLIIPGFMYPYKTGRVFIGQSGMSSVIHAEKWRKTVDDIHHYGSKVIFQIAAGGIACDPVSSVGDKFYVSGPSPNIVVNGINKENRELTKIEIEGIIESFINSAVNAINVSGVDGIMIHYAHGYLLSQFASPYSNRRNDEYGGENSVENRARIIRKIIDGIRQSIPKERQNKVAIICKCNGHDCIGENEGITPQICAETINEVKKSGVDLFEISCGFLNPMTMSRGLERPLNKAIFKGSENKVAEMTYKEILKMNKSGFELTEGYTEEYAKVVRKLNPDVKLAIVGGNRNIHKMEEMVKRGHCEMVSIARPLIRDPFLVDRFYKGEIIEAQCKSCNQCFLRGRSPNVACGYPL